MDKFPEPRTTCLVKVIVNPRAEESFTVKWTLYPEKKVNVKIITPNVQQLKSIVNEMKKELGQSKYAFRVQFNWKNVPQEIQQDSSFKKEMFKLFQNSPALDVMVTPAFFKSRKEQEQDQELDIQMFESFASHVRTYISQYGANPDFKIRTPKGVKKIHNYIKTVCGKHDMVEKEALMIADLVFK